MRSLSLLVVALAAASCLLSHVLAKDTVCTPPFPGFPQCEAQSNWLRVNWKSDPHFQQKGVDGTSCSFLRYYSRLNSSCPDPDFERPNEYTRNSDGTITFTVYRAVSSSSKYSRKLMNQNGADLGGVLSYLHTEVVPTDMSGRRSCQRKFGIDSIAKFRVTMKNPPEFKGKFSSYVAYDGGKCTVPHCEEWQAEHGYTVGHQNQAGNPRARYGNSMWYSFAGKGACSYPTGAKNCTYSFEYLGRYDLDQLVDLGMSYETFVCDHDGVEFSRKSRREPCVTDRSVLFWRDPCDARLCEYRIEKLIVTPLITANQDDGNVTVAFKSNALAAQQ